MRKGSITAGLSGRHLRSCRWCSGAGAPLAETDKPKYGGTLRDRHGLRRRSPRCPGIRQDWNWKLNHDTGQFYEQLFAADLSKSVKNGGPHPFYARRLAALRRHPRRAGGKLGVEGEPAAHRDQAAQGHHVSGEAGRDARSRELVADDVVFSYNRLANSPRKLNGLLQPRRQGGRRPTSTRWSLAFNGSLRRVGLPVRLRILLAASIPKEVADAGGEQLEERRTAPGPSC